MSESNSRAPELEPAKSSSPDTVREYSNPPPAAGNSSGCNCAPAAQQPNGDPSITISITPTTGGQFVVTVDKSESVENLKKTISKRLKVPKERICLLHRERQLREGTLEENRLQDGSRLTLLPSVESGLLAQRPEQSVMQALESLSDSQVNDFLSGKAPLNLTMRLGDHMMLIQLQLSTVTPTTGTSAAPVQLSPELAAAAVAQQHQQHQQQQQQQQLQCDARRAANMLSALSGSPSTGGCPSKLSLVGSLANTPSPSPPNTPTSPISPCCAGLAAAVLQQQQQLAAVLQTPPATPPGTNTTWHHQHHQPQQQALPLILQHRHQSSASSSRHRHVHQARHPYHHNHRHAKKFAHVAKPSCVPGEPSSTDAASTEVTSSRTAPASSCDCVPKAPKKKLCNNLVSPASQNLTQDSNSSENPCTELDCSAANATTAGTPLVASNAASGSPLTAPPTPTTPTSPETASVDTNSATSLDTTALAEASRNLTQKLKQLSSEDNAKRRQGAIIESMHHHGKGVYTGTFSGTLNPALQDRHGRPKRDISTIIHILNDLLCATPATTANHYRYHRQPTAHRTSVAPTNQAAATAQPGTMFVAASNGQTAATTTVGDASVGCLDSSNPNYSPAVDLFKENEATKGKMNRLRLVMAQRREKMRARRQARAAPYTTKWAAVTPDPDPNASSSSSTSSSPATGKSSSETQNEPELQPCSPEPVVA